MDDKTATNASFVLRISGSDLSGVSAFCGLEPYKREGGANKRTVKLHYDLPSESLRNWDTAQSGIASFFIRHRGEFRDMAQRPGVDRIVLDVGLNFDAEKMSLNVPLRQDVLEAIGSGGVHLNIAVYRTDEGAD